MGMKHPMLGLRSDPLPNFPIYHLPISQSTNFPISQFPNLPHKPAVIAEDLWYNLQRIKKEIARYVRLVSGHATPGRASAD